MYVIGGPKGKADELANSLGAKPVFTGPIEPDDAILIDDMQLFAKAEPQITTAVHKGAVAVLLNLKAGKYHVGNTDVAVDNGPSELHFVSRATGHPLVAGFQPDDFKFWYNAKVDRVSPLLRTPGFKAAGWEPVLLTFNKIAVGCKADGKGRWCISQIDLANRIVGNPVAAVFARRVLEVATPTR